MALSLHKSRYDFPRREGPSGPAQGVYDQPAKLTLPEEVYMATGPLEGQGVRVKLRVENPDRLVHVLKLLLSPGDLRFHVRDLASDRSPLVLQCRKGVFVTCLVHALNVGPN
ncbi:MAG: hypothetical protein WD034_09910 [Parvibaculum sp.]